MARPVREIDIIPGVGGQLRIDNSGDNIKARVGGVDPNGTPLPTTQRPDAGRNFEIGIWEIRHRYINADVTHSGSNGAKKYRRTGVDFTFSAQLPWDSSGAFGSFPQMAFLPNNGVTAETDSSFRITFRLGDESFYPDGHRKYYYCNEVLLSKCTVVTDARGDEVIRVLIEGQGSGLLEGYQGTTLEFGT